jgi:hypothetical protein
MHKSIMIVLSIVHMIIILCIIAHMFTLGTIESENKYCFITWPMMHLFYAFVNYIYTWFACYNSCEIGTKSGHQIILTSRKFLKIFTIFCFVPIPLKILAENACHNWTFSTDAVVKEMAHMLGETLILLMYFTWFERKYTAFRIIYKESVF